MNRDLITGHGEFVLCLYFKDDSRKRELAARGRQAHPDVKYRYWKSDDVNTCRAATPRSSSADCLRTFGGSTPDLRNEPTGRSPHSLRNRAGACHLCRSPPLVRRSIK